MSSGNWPHYIIAVFIVLILGLDGSPRKRKEPRDWEEYGRQWGRRYSEGNYAGSYGGSDGTSSPGEKYGRNNYGQYYSQKYASKKFSVPLPCRKKTSGWIRDPERCDKAWLCKPKARKSKYKYKLCPKGKIVPAGIHKRVTCVDGDIFTCELATDESETVESSTEESEEEGVKTTTKPFRKKRRKKS